MRLVKSLKRLCYDRVFSVVLSFVTGTYAISLSFEFASLQAKLLLCMLVVSFTGVLFPYYITPLSRLWLFLMKKVAYGIVISVLTSVFFLVIIPTRMFLLLLGKNIDDLHTEDRRGNWKMHRKDTNFNEPF